MQHETVTANTDYVSVTELAGDEVSSEQIQRLCNRYYWSANYVSGKDVVEAACGTGQGLGYLARKAKSCVGGDYSEAILERAKKHYGTRLPLLQFDAQNMPFDDNSKDVILLHEALYYLPDAEAFFAECRRVLRPGGYLLISTANKDLYDFNPSPFTHKYYGVREFNVLREKFGFQLEFFGDTPVETVSLRQKTLRPIKKMAVSLNLIPKSMKYKKLLKRFVFGGLVPMPAEITASTAPHIEPVRILADTPDQKHKVILVAAKLIDDK